MAVPTYVNTGTVGSTSSAATLAPALPASRVNNRLLLALISVGAASKTLAASAGWTIGGQDGTAGRTIGWAYRLVSGSETACTWTWTGNAPAIGQIVQINGNDTVTPASTTSQILATNAGQSQIPYGGLTSDTDNSMVWIALSATTNVADSVNVDSNYTDLNRGTANSQTIHNMYGTISVAGYTSTSEILQLAASVATGAMAIEIHGTGSGTLGGSRATQSTMEVMEGHPQDAKLRATQSSLQTLQIHSEIPYLRATQVTMQVLLLPARNISPAFWTDPDVFYPPTVTQLTNVTHVYPPPFIDPDIFFPHRVRHRHAGHNEDGNKRMVLRKETKHMVYGESTGDAKEGNKK